MRTLTLFVLFAGCTASNPVSFPSAPDFATRGVRCQGIEDEAKVAWWDGEEGEGHESRIFMNDVRYLCVDHGPEHHGYWFEVAR